MAFTAQTLKDFLTATVDADAKVVMVDPETGEPAEIALLYDARHVEIVVDEHWADAVAAGEEPPLALTVVDLRKLRQWLNRWKGDMPEDIERELIGLIGDVDPPEPAEDQDH
jgi:hypothetical protein